MTAMSDNRRYLRIQGRQAEVGMYIHALHCSWLDNPFWRKSFLLVDVGDRDRVRQSVPQITIDLAKGRGLTLTGAATTGAGDPPPPTPAPKTPATATRGQRRRALSGIEAAQATTDRAVAGVTALFGEARLGQAIQTEDLVPIVDDLAAAMMRDAGAMVSVTRMKDRDQYTYIHSVAVGALMMGLARQLGLAEEDVRVAGMAGLLHDIGKMQVPVEIVDKTGPLTADELTQMRRHPDHGHATLLDMDGLDPRILDVCRSHHEKMDGSGYPQGLTGADLGVFARMSAVCDVYDAVTSIRSYKRAWSPHDALAQMLAWTGHFDPEMLHAFIASLGIHPFGALVRLQSNRLGLVIRDGEAPVSPVVRVFFAVPDQQFLPAQDVATAADPIIRVERGDYWFGARWPALHATMMEDPATCPATYAALTETIR